MKRIQPLKKLDSLPDPYQCFDVIAGTGTGAVQACMLGRLRMSVHSAIEAYANLARDVFSEKKRLGSGSFKRTKLKESLRNIVRNTTGDPEEPMMERQQTEIQCKTLVFAMSSHNMRAGIPTAFRSYHVTANAGPDCTIWETLCATMAHPDLFKSFVIGEPPLNQSFVDAGLGCNNPLAHVLAEVKTLYPKRHVASITSIGTGHTRTIQVPNTSILRHFLPIATIVAMKGIAMDTERVAEEMARRFRSTNGVYFRLNVDQGVQGVGVDGWEQLSAVLDHTRAYTRLVNVNKRIDQVAQAIHIRKPTVSAMQLDGEIQAETAGTRAPSLIRRCPAPTPIFTGCELKISKIESCIAVSAKERKVCVVHGLGGAGKTQMVLKVIERTYEQWKEVVYVDASTKESIESELKRVAISQKVGDEYQDALQWLELCPEQWLVVLDNADDPSLPLRNYIPRGNHGSVVITTRLSGMLSLARGTHSNCSVSDMDPDDALALLLKLAQKQDRELSRGEEEDAKALLQAKDLGYFALGIVHAGSYIGQSPHMSIAEYRSLFMRKQQRALEAYSKLPLAVKADDYRHTVYTAWLMCYELLGPRARGLLWLIGFLHHTGIRIEIFRRAANNILSYKPEFPTTSIEDSARQKLQELLCSFLDANQLWDELSFTETIGEIVSRSLLEFDRMNQSYRIHVLVQDWVRTIVPFEAEIAIECAMALLSISTPLDDSLESVVFRMSLGLHVDKVLLETLAEIGANHALMVFYVYNDRGQWKQAEKLMIQACNIRKSVLGVDHPDTLTTLHDLAHTYFNLNRLEEARDLQAQVLDARKRVLGDNHPHTLSTMHNLAYTYFDLNRLEEARDLQVQVLDAQKRVLGDNHPHTLTAMHNLALTYSKLNRLDEARDLQVQALDAQKRVLGDDHPRTLTTMHNLASTYFDLNQLEEARDLQVQVLDAQKRVLGYDHPDTLRTTCHLAATYSEIGLWEEAEKLRINVDIFARVFGEDSEWAHAARSQLQKISRLSQKASR